MPVYEIAPHPDFSFKVGDVLLKLPSKHVPSADDTDGSGHARVDGTCGVAIASDSLEGDAPMAPAVELDAKSVEGEGEEGDSARAMAASSLKYIGEVVSVGPQLQVRWMDGTTGMLDPEEAYLVNTEEVCRRRPCRFAIARRRGCSAPLLCTPQRFRQVTSTTASASAAVPWALHALSL